MCRSPVSSQLGWDTVAGLVLCKGLWGVPVRGRGGSKSGCLSAGSKQGADILLVFMQAVAIGAMDMCIQGYTTLVHRKHICGSGAFHNEQPAFVRQFWHRTHQATSNSAPRFLYLTGSLHLLLQHLLINIEQLIFICSLFCIFEHASWHIRKFISPYVSIFI